VTATLIVANLLVFAVMVAVSGHLPLGGGFRAAVLIDAGASIGVPSWRWVTAAFIHVNALHILMNMWVLAQIGVLGERAIGRGLFLATYVLTGAAGNVLGTFLALARDRPPAVSAGASGAIMGLFGVAAVYAWRTGQRPIASALAKNVLFVLVVGFLLTSQGAVAVDNAAHIGGLILGAVIGLLRARWPRPTTRAQESLLFGASIAIVAAAFVFVRLGG
jgi:rhomboid protease GluP